MKILSLKLLGGAFLLAAMVSAYGQTRVPATTGSHSTTPGSGTHTHGNRQVVISQTFLRPSDWVCVGGTFPGYYSGYYYPYSYPYPSTYFPYSTFGYGRYPSYAYPYPPYPLYYPTYPVYSGNNDNSGYSYPPYQPPVSRAAPPTSSAFQLGHDWGQDVRSDIVTWDQFVAYVRQNLLSASATDRDEFRRGFVSSYGTNGETAFDKAWQAAQPPPPSSVRP